MDMDCILDDALWKAGDWTDSRALFSWSPPPPPSFIEPEDLASLMASARRCNQDERRIVAVQGGKDEMG
jgi:hypothetical protein